MNYQIPFLFLIPSSNCACPCITCILRSSRCLQLLKLRKFHPLYLCYQGFATLSVQALCRFRRYYIGTSCVSLFDCLIQDSTTFFLSVFRLTYNRHKYNAHKLLEVLFFLLRSSHLKILFTQIYVIVIHLSILLSSWTDFEIVLLLSPIKDCQFYFYLEHHMN